MYSVVLGLRVALTLCAEHHPRESSCDLATGDHFGCNSSNHSGHITLLIASDPKIPLAALIDKWDRRFEDWMASKRRSTQSRSAIARHRDTISWLGWLWEAAALNLEIKCRCGLSSHSKRRAELKKGPTKGARRHLKASCRAGAPHLTFAPVPPQTYLQLITDTLTSLITLTRGLKA